MASVDCTSARSTVLEGRLRLSRSTGGFTGSHGGMVLKYAPRQMKPATGNVLGDRVYVD
jgi:hypothetical protein